MDAILILCRCREAISEMERLAERMARLRECAAKSTANYSLAGGGACSSGDKMSAYVGALDECERDLAERRRRYECELLASCKICDMLPNSEGAVLYEYYVKRRKLKDIARDKGYAIRHVQRIKADGERSARALDNGTVAALFPSWYQNMSYDVI